MSSVITLAFENWKAQEAAAGKAVELNEFVFANVPNLDETKPIDRNESLPEKKYIVHHQAVNKTGLVSENAVAYSVTLGTDAGDFDFNWIGLLNKESGTVAMITHVPTQKKIKTKDGQQGNVLTRSFLLEFNGAAEETQIQTNAETWQIDFTARLFGIDEVQRLINLDTYGVAAFFDDGFLVTKENEKYTVNKGLAYISGLRGELKRNQSFNALKNTKIYADFSYQGNLVSQWVAKAKLTVAENLADYTDNAGFNHFVYAIAEIDNDGNIKDLRIKKPSDVKLDEIKKELDKKISEDELAQELGDDPKKGISQDAVTKAIEESFVNVPDATQEVKGKVKLANEIGIDETKALTPSGGALLGHGVVGSFELGLNFIDSLTNTDQLVTLENEFGKQTYCWTGEFPKPVPAGSTPESTGGVAKGAWFRVGDAGLNSELSKTFKSASVMGLVANGLVNEISTLENIKRESSEANTPVVVPATGNVRSRMHNEPVDDLMPEQFVTLGNLKGRLDVYDPEPVPSWNEAVDGVTGGTTTINADWLYAEFDKLVNASKDKLIRQEDIGTSQDGAYPIRQYIWLGANHSSSGAPDKNLKEILVTAGIHGSETVSMLGLLYFMKDLVEKGDEIPALRWLYYNTRIRIVPVANPWGVSQLPKVRNNSRGVNLNRNFDYLWDTLPTTKPGDADYKGDAPFSESETEALRKWFAQFASRAVAYIDVHSMGIYTGNSAKAPHFVGFCSPLAESIASEIFTKFANKHTRIEIPLSQKDPTSRTHATVKYGLPSITCEHTDTAWAREGASYSQAKDTSYSITGAVKMYGNVIAGFAKLAVRQLFPIHISDDNSDILVPSGINWIQLFPRNSYDAGIDGVIKIRACAVVKNTSDTATDVFLGVIGDGTAVDRKAVPYTTIQAQSTTALYVDNIFRVDKSQRKYALSVHVASKAASVTVVRYYAIIEPQYLGYDVGNI
ncbi:phage tail protein [Providencia sp. 1709051003]|uniref:phage tail-collar fiber domain-containing protein n=1 Tax=Providencia sp. 1709051003 TaxID=2603246 RepID=UPI0034D5C1CB